MTANLKNCTFISYLRSKRKVNTTVTLLIREDGSGEKLQGRQPHNCVPSSLLFK